MEKLSKEKDETVNEKPIPSGEVVGEQTKEEAIPLPVSNPLSSVANYLRGILRDNKFKSISAAGANDYSEETFRLHGNGEYLNVTGIAGIELTSKAFASAFSFFPILLTIMATCFVMGTMLCGSYYGLKGWQFLVGESKFKTRSFQLVYCICIVIGSAMNFKSIINLSDAVTLFMAVPNLFALFILSNVVVKEVKRYCKKYDVGLFSEVKDEPYDEDKDVE